MPCTRNDIDQLALRTASAREVLRKAEQKHVAAEADAQAIASRIAQCRARIEAITSSGDRSMAALGELGLLQADAHDLEALLTEAVLRAESMTPNSERQALAAAEAALQAAADEIAYTEALALARRADDLIVAAAKAAISSGAAAAKLSPAAAWRPSPALENLVKFGRPTL